MSEVKTNKITSLASNNDITLDPDGTGDVVVASGHNLGVGTTAPALPLEVNGSTNVAVFRSDASNSIIQLANSTGTGGDNGVCVGSVGDDLFLRAGDSERVRIDSSGNVGIGTASPTQPLTISASGANGLFLLRDESDAADSCRLFFDSSNTRYALFAKDGVLSIRSGGTPGSSSGTERVQFTVNGINSAAVAANGTVSAANLFISGGNNFQKSSSSSRYKTDITDSTRGLSDVMKMRSVTYKGINDGDRFFGGLIAEEVHDAGLIEYVDYRQDDDGNDIPEGVHYGHMVALAFKAIQELKAELDAEKAKTKTLEAKVAALEAGE